MYDVILGILVVITLFIGIRLVVKLRELSSATDDNRKDRVANRRMTPRASLDLKIEQPSSLDDAGNEEHKTPKQ